MGTHSSLREVIASPSSSLRPPSSPARSRCWSSPPPPCSSSRPPLRQPASTTTAAAIPTSTESTGESIRGSIPTRVTTRRKTTGSRTTTAMMAMRTRRSRIPSPLTSIRDRRGRGSSLIFLLLAKLRSSLPALACVPLLDPMKILHLPPILAPLLQGLTSLAAGGRHYCYVSELCKDARRSILDNTKLWSTEACCGDIPAPCPGPDFFGVRGP